MDARGRCRRNASLRWHAGGPPKPLGSRGPMNVRRPFVLLLAAAGLLASACMSSTPSNRVDRAEDVADGDCIRVDMAVSPEKIDLLSELARTFRDSSTARVGDRCIDVRPTRKASGAAMTALARGWDEAQDGASPVIWSPASSAWGAVLNQRLADAGQAPLVGE